MVGTQPYDKVKAVNNTALGYYILSPLEFKKYYDNPTESVGDWYDVGSAIHCLILQPEDFYDKYIVLDYKKPQNEQQKVFIEKYCDFLSLKKEEELLDTKSNDTFLLEAYKVAYSTKGKTDKKMLEEATELQTNLNSYMQFIRLELNGRTILSSGSMESVKQCCNALLVNPKSDLVIKTPELKGDDIKVYNELEIYFDFKGMHCKSRLDKLIIDKPNRKIYIVDIKTTSKPVGKFYESFRDYDYERQFAFYCLAVYEYLDKQIGVPSLDEYSVTCICATVSTKEPYESRIYGLPMEKVMFSVQNIKRVLTDLVWHFENNKWNYPKCYYEGGNDYEVLEY